ncbi:MAG: methyltransferase domain-containing protein [Actinomycetota bacterium]|nr:methyltransferase domain-containing protein [Actinomycetota bacterium]
MRDHVDRFARAFEAAVGAYERGRPGYPADALAWLTAELGLRAGRTVVDLGAGTGKLTRLLVSTAASVLAVEPGDAMRAQLVASVPGATALNGSAEAIPLPAESVDAITVAQAFHWFRPGPAIAEMHRVLRPGGGVAILWNTRDDRDPLQRQVEMLLASLRAKIPARDEHDPRDLLPASGLFSDVRHERFEHVQELDEDTFVERFTSVSFVSAALPAERDRIEAELRELVRDVARPIVIPYGTDVFVSRRL